MALSIWLFGLFMFFALGLWNFHVSNEDAENQLVNEAGYIASQLAGLLALPQFGGEGAALNALLTASMEDERLYAVRVELQDGHVVGQRRNYLWEPIPWDSEIADNCVQGMDPIKYGGQVVGKVEVWLSPRLNEEEEALLAKRERWRFGIASLAWSLAFIFLFWHVGDLHRLKKFFGKRKSEDPGAAKNRADQLVHDLSADKASPEEAQKLIPAIDSSLGRRHQRKEEEAWFVTAGMFRQIFAKGPDLINKLYAQGETAGLCHLGRILEQAAPCLGAQKLQQKAREMQAALNNPECQSRALPVEECARALAEVLEALSGKEK